MALEASDLEAIAALIDKKVSTAVADVKSDVAAVEAQPAVQDAEKAVEYYIHLADGNVVTLPADQAESSHVNGVAVIGKYQVGS